MRPGHSTICYVSTTLKAQPFLLNICCPGHPYVPVGTGESAPSSGDRPSGSDSNRDAGQSGDRTDEDPLKETQTTDGPMDDGTDTRLKG